VDLKWTTASQINNDYFTIEKTRDGINFEIVEKVSGAGNSSSTMYYTGKDSHPYEGQSYYRLKQTDYNGACTYSDLVAVKFKSNDEFTFSVYPNPSDGSSFNVVMKAIKGEEIFVAVYDVNGNEAFSKTVMAESFGKQVFPIELTHKLKRGVYLIVATFNHQVFNKNLIVQ